MEMFSVAVTTINAIKKKVAAGEKVTLDLSQLMWTFPEEILPIAITLVQIKKRKAEFNIIPPKDVKVASYLKRIGFPEGVSLRETGSTLIPLIQLPQPQKEEVLAKIFDLVDPDKRNDIRYFLGELIDNVYEHSLCQLGMITAQRYPNLKCLHISIFDDGIGISGSLRNAGYPLQDDADALAKACQGTSAKRNGGGRGYGLPTSIRLLTEGLGGELLLASGCATFYKGSKESGTKIFKAENSLWKGTAISIRLPMPLKEVNIYEYIENKR